MSNYLQSSCTLLARSKPPMAFINELLNFVIRYWESVRKLAPNNNQKYLKINNNKKI